MDKEEVVLIKPRESLKKELEERLAIGKHFYEDLVKDSSLLDQLERECEKWNTYNEELLMRSFNRARNRYYEKYKGIYSSFGLVDYLKGVDVHDYSYRVELFKRRMISCIDEIHNIINVLILIPEQYPNNKVSINELPDYSIEQPVTIYCLGIDVVEYSLKDGDIQLKINKSLTSIIQESQVYKSNPRAYVILPTGDGLIISLVALRVSPFEILKFAASIQSGITTFNELNPDAIFGVRMGINTGIGYLYKDINGNTNIAGAVINETQRVMNFGEKGHFLASRTAFDHFQAISHDIRAMFTFIGPGITKHGLEIPIYNIVNHSIGNKDIPKSLMVVKQLQVINKDLAVFSQAKGDIPLNAGWIISKAPTHSRPIFRIVNDVLHGNVISISSEGSYCIDNYITGEAKKAIKITYIVREVNEFFLYVRLSVRNSQKDMAKQVWLCLNPQTAVTKPYENGQVEWSYPIVPEKIENNWQQVTVNLKEAISKTFGIKDGWELNEVLGFRFRGNVIISKVILN